MKCVLHIGTEKTGTSLLQEWFYLCEDALQKCGVYLSREFGVPNNRHIPTYFRGELDDFTRAHKITSKEDKLAFFCDFEETFEREVKNAHGCDTFLITSEHFHSRLTEPSEIEALGCFLDRHFDQIEVICYFREQSEMALSFYSTHLKGAGTLSLDTFLEQVRPEYYYYNFLEIANRWSAVFGRENCNFRLYDRARFQDGDIRKDFLECLGRRADSFGEPFEKQSSNPSLSALQAAIYRKINQHIPYWDTVTGVNETNVALKKRVFREDSLKCGVIGTEKQGEVIARFAQCNSVFFDTYFESPTKFAYSDKSSSAEVKLNAVDVERLLDIVLGVVCTDEDRCREKAPPQPQVEVVIYGYSDLAKWIEEMDYKIHRWISETRLVTSTTRRRFKSAADRRWRALERLRDAR